ncbi:TM0106 family RecB-like putative nuclease [Aquihabitans daechungensis]|uniref:TM0106 family RecB-like putative nuclease n=1 Tax=Aquihabitans daechungensis TaxID=1052257 RepID=UPI003BA07F55
MKHHIAADGLAPDETSQPPGCSTLSDPTYAAASTAAGFAPRRSRDDLLQLAHYHRMLETLGHVSGTAAGGIIGKERVVAWHHLDEPSFQHTWKLGRDAKQSPLERYDHEFAFRIDVLKAAAAGAPIVEPVATAECESCPWVGDCWPKIEAADSTSLLPRYGYKQWHALRRRGITSRAQLAGLDERTAYLLGKVPGLPALVAEADGADPSATLTDLESCPAAAQVVILAEHGVHTAADLARLDRKVLVLADAPGLGLVDAIRGARVITGGGRAVLRWGVEVLEVPGAEVEIDIDMENAIDGTHYLWGALVDGHYHAFASWDQPSSTVDSDVFIKFWTWLQHQRTAAQNSRRSLIAYCWSRGAEAGALRRGAVAAEAAGHPGVVDAVDEFLDGDELIDLLAVFRDQVVTGQGSGLKVVAPLAGFAWRDDDPGGEASMLWHQQAIGAEASPERAEARQRLLDYNEDDVRATAAIRHWMRSGTIV